MTILSLEDRPNRKIEIDLTGPEGNSFCLLGYAKRLCKKLGWDYEEISEKMTSDDYDHLINVFDNYFGDFVDLYR